MVRNGTSAPTGRRSGSCFGLATILAALLSVGQPVGSAKAQDAEAQQPQKPSITKSVKPAADASNVNIGYIHWTAPWVTLSLTDMPSKEDGIAGARMAITDNNTTGVFTKQHFELITKGVETPEAAVAALEALASEGAPYIVADVPADVMLALADAAKGRDVLLFNVGAREERLREAECRANVVHVTPSYSMLADGLAQYLVWKKWNRWFLLTGANPQDKLWADALKRAATRFGAEIVEERVYAEADTARRTDSGHVQVQRQMPVFTQNAADHDVVVVADESEVFGTYVPYRLWDPRPVAGSGGLRPTSWDPSHEQWGAYQMQNRFFDLNRRPMRAIDGDAWTAVRIVGEATTRTKSVDPKQIIEYIRGPKLSIAAFKGQKLTIRNWNNQLRQPILLGDGRSIVSVSPQEGFLHQNTELDTLGYDQPETECRF